MNLFITYIQLFHEAEKFTAYSLAVHKAIGLINVIFLSILQVQQYSMSLITVDIYFGVLIVHAVLGVGEVIGVQLQLPGSVLRFFGHSSHLNGALAAITLIFVVNVVFACVILALLLSLWIPTVIFIEIMIKKSRTTDSTQFPPV